MRGDSADFERLPRYEHFFVGGFETAFEADSCGGGPPPPLRFEIAVHLKSLLQNAWCRCRAKIGLGA